jgi:hypothetical protein
VNLGTKDVVRLQAVYGEGIENYMNDAPADVGIENNPGNDHRAGQGRHASGHRHRRVSRPHVERQVQHGDRVFQRGHRQHRAAGARRVQARQYALGNLLYTPVPGVTAGVELQWGNRENFSDGFSTDIYKIQFSFKYAFSKTY